MSWNLRLLLEAEEVSIAGVVVLSSVMKWAREES